MGTFEEELRIQERDRVIAEKFEDHTISVVLLAGEGEGMTMRVECKGADKDRSLCEENHCQVDALIRDVGWPDVIKAAGEIELSKLSARVDWSDYDEPWVEVEP
jgi:hypothetical protein